MTKSGLNKGHWYHLFQLHNSEQLNLSMLSCKLGIIIYTTMPHGKYRKDNANKNTSYLYIDI